MRVKIYQIDPDRDKNRVKFQDYARTCAAQGGIEPSIYDEVFSAEIDETAPEEIYRRFNMERHPLYRGHSLSVSDVVVTEGGAFFCEDIGFQPVEFDVSKTHTQENLMDVVYVEPNRAPYAAQIEHKLEAEQQAVCGYIDCVYNGDDTAIVCNEEAKLIGMEGNRRIHDGQTIIAGPFFVVGLTEDDFRGLSAEETEKYLARFAEPEKISQEEVEADTGFFLFSC